MEKNSRRAPRIERPFIVKYRCPEIGQTEWLMSPMRNLSVSGVRFIGEHGFAMGSVLDLQLCLPNAAQPITAKGLVVWTRRLDPGPMSEHGVTFSEADPATTQQIAQAVEFFLRKHRSPSHGE